MKISELELPQSLFTETTSPCGTVTRLVAPDKLVLWAEEGRGDAIISLCQSTRDNRLATIDAWERERIRQLEAEWLEAGNDEVMQGHRYENVKRYHMTRENVAREAEQKRDGVRARMGEHQAAIESLVQEAREFIQSHQQGLDDNDVLAYLLFFCMIAVGCYSVFT